MKYLRDFKNGKKVGDYSVSSVFCQCPSIPYAENHWKPVQSLKLIFKMLPASAPYGYAMAIKKLLHSYFKLQS